TYTMQLNLGGIGKGYAADLGTKFIRDAGYDAGFFSVGGSSMSVFGMMENGQLTAWDVAVNNPRAGVLATGSAGEFLSVRERDISLSSSGDYENCYYYQKDGRRLCHIINPNTGYPINADPNNTDGSGMICASVFGLSAAEGDATSTALLVMGKDRAIAYIQNELQGKDVLFVYYDGETYSLYTNMAAENYTLYADIPIVNI
ncbi:MAG: FAD:protein FMN transferase, partial [Clostridiales bacterium]|nr:FAD:protein FMN transferase [Clostridiales bacterium]